MNVLGDVLRAFEDIVIDVGYNSFDMENPSALKIPNALMIPPPPQHKS